jgi:hypothetical protein
MKVFYIECSNTIWLDVAEILRDRLNWQPVYWTGHRDWIEKTFKRYYPEVPFHHNVSAVLGQSQPNFSKLDPAVIDQVLLENLSVCELYAIKMMDRMDALGSFSYQERIRHYRRLVAYWLAILDALKPNLVLFSDTPHMVYDYILYELCQLKNIRTMLFEASNVFGLAYLRERIYGETILSLAYKEMLEKENWEEIQPSSEVNGFLESLRGGYQEVPLYIRYVSKRDLNEQNTIKTIIRKLLDFKKYPQYTQKQFGILSSQVRRPQSYLKEPGKTPEESGISNLGFRWFRYRAHQKMKALNKYYHSRAIKEVRLNPPYIYIALSYQPEATTSPKGDFFVNLDLMVYMISQAVPEGWLLYVKEHPSQFERTWTHRSQSAREKYFYDDLVRMENVRLIPTSFSSFDLLDNAVAIATVTGSVGWQAVNRGKPALVFGNPWYLGCEGVFSIRSFEDCRFALKKIQEGYEVDDNRVRVFAVALEKVGIRLDLEGKTKRFQDSYVATSDTIASVIQHYFEESIMGN